MAGKTGKDNRLCEDGMQAVTVGTDRLSGDEEEEE